ncbi:DUF6090 family protein [Gramella jeungdoensis]|uniref:DUF6090 family protein n=1 Tax=Gramella jeungdoensis TaxID=708091 RepID=A0ABT0YZG3_9FLAO|nr:DUF6090 family protein [Gramella jeungdoensis]MCM8568866.1 DUF6090 family protein [Gramella jeungdoensis]
MIKFFRNIRHRLLRENRISRYLIYAIGEIILVVIGILIALQINGWNEARLNEKKERAFLLEIKENLNEDRQTIENIQSRNAIKLKTIDSAFYYLSIENGKNFSNLLPIITNYDMFTPTSVAFDNMVSSGNINLLSSDELRKTISHYYSSEAFNGIQDQIKITTQDFLRDVAPKMVNLEMMKFVTKLDFDVRSAKEITVYKDTYVLSHLFVMKNKTIEHNNALKKNAINAQKLMSNIEEYLVEN